MIGVSWAIESHAEGNSKHWGLSYGAKASHAPVVYLFVGWIVAERLKGCVNGANARVLQSAPGPVIVYVPQSRCASEPILPSKERTVSKPQNIGATTDVLILFGAITKGGRLWGHEPCSEQTHLKSGKRAAATLTLG